MLYIYINYINYKPTYNWAPPCGRGQTPLFKAAFYGHVSVVEQLLKSGASVEARDSFGRGLSWSAQPPRNAELRKNQPDWGQIYIYIYIIIIYYIYTCIYICSRIYMFFSSSFWFVSVFVLCNCVLWCGMVVLFFGSAFCMWYFCLQVMFTTEKKHVPHAEKKTRNMHTNCKIAPQGTCWPLILVCLFFHLCFCMFWIGSMYPGSCLPQKEQWTTWQRTKTLLFAWKYPIDVEEYALCEAVPNMLHVVTLGSNHFQETLFKTAETFKHRQTSSNLEPKSCEINGRFMTFPLRPDAAVRCCWEGLCLCGRAAPEIWRFGGGAEWERPRPQRQAPGESWEDLMVDACWCSNV